MSDETPRRPASDNPWYVLMTIAGEQGEDFDPELHEKNRRFWHGWLAQGLEDEVKADLVARNVVDGAEFAPFSADESICWKNEVERRGIELPDRADLINFSFCDFEAPLCCRGFYFSGDADFESAAFSGNAYFARAAFSGDAYFGSAAFSGDAYFGSAAFSGYAFFESAAFLGYAYFESAAFSGYADFGSAAFSGYAYFGSAAFLGYADFESAAFSGNADFRSAAFSGDADFERAAFAGYADFARAAFSERADFTSAKLSSSVDFEGVIFESEPPKFFGAELHEDTTWLVKAWPPMPSEARAAYDHRRAYERLKLLMDGQKKTHDEHMFHRLELRCREVEEGWPANIPSRLFGLISGYGWSLKRPCIALGGVIALGWLWMGVWFARSETCPDAMGGPEVWGCLWSALGVSVSNTFGFLGLGRQVLSDEIASLNDFGWFEIGAGVQFFLGPILLFFLFLALRNRYRMR